MALARCTKASAATAATSIRPFPMTTSPKLFGLRIVGAPSMAFLMTRAAGCAARTAGERYWSFPFQNPLAGCSPAGSSCSSNRGRLRARQRLKIPIYGTAAPTWSMPWRIAASLHSRAMRSALEQKPDRLLPAASSDGWHAPPRSMPRRLPRCHGTAEQLYDPICAMAPLLSRMAWRLGPIAPRGRTT